jgi:hypothetical protein
MIRSCPRICVLAASLLVLGLAAGCPGDDPDAEWTPTDPQTADPDEVTGGCEAVEFESLEVSAFEQVPFEVDGVFADDVAARVYRPDSDYWVPAPVWQILDDEGDIEALEVSVPPHPAGLSGGPLRVQMYGDDFVCPTVELQVAPLDEAPGEADRVVAAMQSYIDANAARNGVTRAELVEAMDVDAQELGGTLPATLMPLAMAQYGLDHPDNPNALANLLDAEGPLADAAGDAESSLAFIEAVFAERGLAGEIEVAAAAIDTDAPAPEWVADEPTYMPNALVEDTFKVRIDTAAQLSEYMTDAWVACGVSSGWYADLVTAAGLSSAGKNPYWKAGTASFALTGTVLVEIDNAKCKMYPTRLLDLQVAPGGFEILEDEPVDSLELDSATVSALSETWNPARAAAAIGLQAAGSKGAIDDAAKTVAGGSKASKLAPKSSDALDELDNKLVDDLGANLRDWKIGEFAKALDKASELGDLGPFYWRDIDINDGQWLEMFFVTGVFREGECSGVFCAEPYRTGIDELTYTPDYTVFPSENEHPSVSFPAEVTPIEIEVNPRRKVVVPGETITLQMRVKNAYDPTVTWTNSAGVDGPYDVTDRDDTTELVSGNLEFQTPSDPDAYPVIITGTSQSQSGLLNPANGRVLQRPTGIGALTLEPDVQISPPGGCAEPGQTIQFEALYDEAGLPTAELSWEASGGEISDDGLWTAPNRRQVYEVEVTLDIGPNNPAVSDSTQVIVGECNCWYSAEIVGPDGQRSEAQEFGIRSIDSADLPSADGVSFFGFGFQVGTSLATTPFYQWAVPREAVEAGRVTGTWSGSEFIHFEYLEGLGNSWFGDNDASFVHFETPQPLGTGLQVEGYGLSLHPYQDGNQTRYFTVSFSFGVVLDTSACQSETVFDGWRIQNQ